MPLVLLELVELQPNKGFAAVVILNRPEAKNALSKSLHLELARTLGELRQRSDVKVVILIGAGDNFCPGVDLREPVFADSSLMTKESFIGPNNGLWQLRMTKVPVIAAVAGPCITGGMELALNCDIIVASRTAFFQDTHARYGIVPGGGMTVLLPRSIGLHASKWASFTCERIPAERAYELGLVSKLVDTDAELKQAAIDMAAKIMKNDHEVLLEIKRNQHASQAFDVDGALEYEANMAVQKYSKMAASPAATRERLSSKFAARSKL